MDNEEKKKEYRKNFSKIYGIVIIIFILGIYIGANLEKYSINSIQSYLLNSIGFATATNATPPNATPSNATPPNATQPNATPPNATSGNINLTDNILYLESFNFNANSVKPGDKIYLEIVTKGASKNGGTILFKNIENDATFNVKIESISNSPYIKIPNNISKGEYIISEILLVGINSDSSTFSRRYSPTNSNADYVLDFLNKSITVNVEEQTVEAPKVEEPKKESDEEQKKQEIIKSEINKQEASTEKETIKLLLETISLNQNEADINEKVFINFKTNMNISSMKLVFINENNNKMTVHAKSLNKNTYFEIPTETIIGNYSLYSVTISTKDSTIMYSSDGNLKNSEKFNFNTNIIINDIKQQDLFVYNNEDITNEVITKLYDTKSTATIKISAESNPIIDKEIFNIIKGTNKNLIITYHDNQMIFTGTNIKEAKSIDTSVTTSVINKDSDLGNIINDGVLIEYTSNGDLPGRAKVRIKITEEIKNKFNNEAINVYYYNTEKNKFKEIAVDIKATEDDYYEFDLDHNSKYVLVKNKLDKSLLDTVEENVVDFQKSNSTNLSVIGLTIIFVIIIGIIITTIIMIEKRKNNKKIEMSENNIK